MYTRPYLDSSVYITAVQGEPAERLGVCRNIFREAERDRLQIVASTFVVTEVIRDRHAPVLPPEKEGLVDNYLQRSFMQWVELDLTVARQAREIARKFSLKPADSVHIASALAGRADAFLIWDDEVLSKTSGDVDGLPISEPYWEGQVSLLDLDAGESN